MNAKKHLRNKGSKKVGKRSLNSKVIIAIIGVFFFFAIVYFLTPQVSDKWRVSNDGILSYPENRGKVDVNVLKTESSSGYILETISFQSKEYLVEGLLRIPT